MNWILIFIIIYLGIDLLMLGGIIVYTLCPESVKKRIAEFVEKHNIVADAPPEVVI